MTDLAPRSLDEAVTALDHLHDESPAEVQSADSRDGRVYVTDPTMLTAVKVALLTGRPLLLSGPPGAGKSSFASYVARNLGVAYYEFVAVDESRSGDLLWSVDAVRRLSDAHLGTLSKDEDDAVSFARYLTPGPLWWALDPESASRRGLPADHVRASAVSAASDPRVPLSEEPSHQGAVLLIDEIDKADNAFSSGLLVPLGARSFDVPTLGLRVRGAGSWSPLVIISTNNERDLSPAFLRRCVSLELRAPDREQLVRVAERHLPGHRRTDGVRRAIGELADLVTADVDTEAVSAAEFLDMVRVLIGTGKLDVSTEEWDLIRRLVTARTGSVARLARR